MLSTRVAFVVLVGVVLLAVAAPAIAASSTETAYVAALDFAGLPYGENEFSDSQKALARRLAELQQCGSISHGLIISGAGTMSESSPIGMMALTLLYGADEEQANALLAAISGVKNLTNPRLLTATVFFPEEMTLPKTGVTYDKGGLREITGQLVYVPSGADPAAARTVLNDWYKQRFGGEVEIAVTREKPGHPLSINYQQPPQLASSYRITPENVTPELKRSLNFGEVQRNWSTADNSQPWFVGELPLQPLLPGHKWVKGYEVHLARMDAASDEIVARLRADAEELARRVRESYPGIAVVEAGGSNLTPPYLLNGHLTQPSLDLLVPVDDQALLERIGAELVARAAKDSGHTNIMWFSARYRCVFLDEAASGVEDPAANVRRVYREGISMVFPTSVPEGQQRAEADNWRDQWIELYRQTQSGKPLPW